MDLNRLSRGEQILGVTAALLFLLSFFPFWAKYEFEGGELFGGVGGAERASAWNGDVFNILMKLGLLFALIVVVVVLAKAAGALDNVQMPVPLGLVYLGLAGLTFLILLLFAVIGPNEGDAGINVADFGIEVSRGPLLFAGVLLAAGMAFGAFTHFQGEGRATTTGRPGTTAPPPPGA